MAIHSHYSNWNWTKKLREEVFYPRETQCQSASATSVINVTNRFHNALLVSNWLFFSILEQRRMLHRIWFCPSFVQLLNTFFPNRFAFLREICVIRCSPYDTFVFTVHGRRLRTIEVFNKFRRIRKRPNDTESLGCMAIADYFPSQLLWKTKKRNFVAFFRYIRGD